MSLGKNKTRIRELPIADCPDASQICQLKSQISNLKSASQAKGFTLLELLMVLLILGALAAVAFPSIGRGMATMKLKTSSREIAAALRLARSKAIREQQIYLLGFDLENNEIELSSENLQYQKSFSLPQGVSIKKVSLLKVKDEGNQNSHYYFFLPNGMTESFEVLIGNNRGREFRVVQDSLVLSPRVEEVNLDSGPSSLGN